MTRPSLSAEDGGSVAGVDGAIVPRLPRALGSFYSRLVEKSARSAVWVLVVATMVTAVSLYYAVNHLSIDTNTINMLDPKLRFRQLEQELDRSFPQLSDLITVVVDADSAGSAQDLASELAAKLRQHPGLFESVYEPGGGEFFARNGLLYLDTPELQDLADKLADAQPLLGTLAEDTSLRGLLSMLGKAFDEDLSTDNQKTLARLYDRISKTIEGQLAGRPSRTAWRSELLGNAKSSGPDRRAFLLVKPRLDYTHLQAGAEALTAVRELARQVRLDAERGERIRLTGSVAMGDEELASVSEGAKRSSLLSFALVLLVTVFGLRSPRNAIAILLTLAMGLVWTGAFATAAIGPLNLISVNFAVLFIGMGVDFGMQVGLRYKEAFERCGDHTVALAQTGAGMGGALTLAAVAAAAAFFSFLPTSYRGLAELGIIAGFGMFVALTANLTVLPALLTALPRGRAIKQTKGGVLALMSLSVGHYRRTILWAAALALAGSAMLLPRAQFDFNPLNMKDPTTESVSTFLDLLSDPDTTPYTIGILAEDLPAAEALAKRIETLDVVDKTVTLASYVPEEQDEKLAIIDEISLSVGSTITPTSRKPPPGVEAELGALVAFQNKLKNPNAVQLSPQLSKSGERLATALSGLQALPGWPGKVLEDLRQNVVADLPESLDKLRKLLSATRISLESLPPDLKDRYLGSHGQTRIEVYPKEDVRDNQAMRRFVRAVQAVAPNAADSPVALVEGGDTVVHACLQATAWAMLATILLLLGVLRSVLDTVLVLAPLVLAVALTLSSSVLFSIPFDLANIIALPLLVGLSNAYGIYLVMRVRSGTRVDDLFRTSTPRAILFGALTAMVSFGTLAFANHRGMSGMGLLVTLALTYAVLCTLLVLPAILAALESKYAPAIASATPRSDLRAHSTGRARIPRRKKKGQRMPRGQHKP